ncbi:MAG: helix-turn-helix transcriptional regulator [Chloroflexi bacterium]|nr:helix-turn-helix transcriptional regulator [Chloroflexota bacterium]
MRRRKCLPSHLAAALGISHTTVLRWLTGKDVPSVRSCRRLAEYSGVSPQMVLSIAGHLPMVAEKGPDEWPEFREYARQKYPDELDEDMVTMIEDLIERRRSKRYESRKNNP